MWKNISLWVLFISTFASWGAWALVIRKISPIESPQIAFIAFYVTSFLALVTTFAVIGSLVRKIACPGKKMLRCINISLRQGAILAVVCSLALFFQQLRILSWWLSLLLLLIGLVLESLFWESKAPLEEQ